MVREAEFQTEGGGESFENAASGGNYFAADAVAWYEACDMVSGVCSESEDETRKESRVGSFECRSCKVRKEKK